VHPETGLTEFACGPLATLTRRFPGEDKAWHKFHRVKGGFLTVSVAQENVKAR